MIEFVTNNEPGKAGARVIKLTVTRTGKDALEKIAERYGMKEQVIGGRIYEWFMAQDTIVQRAALGLLHDLEVDAAARFMERWAAGNIEVIVVEGESGENAAANKPSPQPEPTAKPRGRKPSRRRGR